MDGLAQLPKKPTVRVVFDKNANPASYIPALQQLRSVAYIMGQVLDSSHLKDFNTTTYRARAVNYYDTLGGLVDVWEVGNEINGDWTGYPNGADGPNPSQSAADRLAVGAKIAAAFDEAKARGLKTAVTFYKEHPGPDSQGNGELPPYELFRWVAENLPDRVRTGIDYAFLSYYDNPALYDWTSYFTRMASTFPNAKVGFGEIGGWGTGSTQAGTHSGSLQAIHDFYGLIEPTVPSFVGGYFYWYYCSDGNNSLNQGDIYDAIWNKIDRGGGSALFLPIAATATGDDGNVPSNVLDNNPNTRWSNQGAGSAITVDLGAIKPVNGADVSWYRGDYRQNTFTVDASPDGSTFTQVYSGTSTGLTSELEKYGFPAINTRYIRVTFQSNTENNWASIEEIRANPAA